MSFLDLAHDRFSCRSISDRELPQDLIDKIIEAGLSAPTAMNKQPFKIWVLKSKEAVATVKAASPCTYGATTFFLVGCNEDECWTREFDGRNFGTVDASIVATHMMLEIADLGLATVWVGQFDPRILKGSFPALEGYHLIALLPVGYATKDEASRPSPRHLQRKSKEELVQEL